MFLLECAHNALRVVKSVYVYYYYHYYYYSYFSETVKRVRLNYRNLGRPFYFGWKIWRSHDNDDDGN